MFAVTAQETAPLFGSRAPSRLSPRYTTFAAAEEAARRLYSSRGSAAIYRVANGGAGLVGEVARDALGRVWVDLTVEGAKFA